MTFCEWTTCNLSSFIDKALDAPEHLKISEHIGSCAGCAAEHQALLETVQACSSLDLDDAPGLRDSILSEVAAVEQCDELISLIATAEEQPPADLRERIALATYSKPAFGWGFARGWSGAKLAGVAAAGIAVVAASISLWSPQSPSLNQSAQVAEPPAQSAPALPEAVKPEPPSPQQPALSNRVPRLRQHQRPYTVALPKPTADVLPRQLSLPIPKTAVSPAIHTEADLLPAVAESSVDTDRSDSLASEAENESREPIRLVDARAEDFLSKSDSGLLTTELNRRIADRNRLALERRRIEMSEEQVAEVKLISAQF